MEKYAAGAGAKLAAEIDRRVLERSSDPRTGKVTDPKKLADEQAKMD